MLELPLELDQTVAYMDRVTNNNLRRRCCFIAHSFPNCPVLIICDPSPFIPLKHLLSGSYDSMNRQRISRPEIGLCSDIQRPRMQGVPLRSRDGLQTGLRYQCPFMQRTLIRNCQFHYSLVSSTCMKLRMNLFSYHVASILRTDRRRNQAPESSRS